MLTVFIGTCDEWIQIFLPNRVFDPEDILFNALSALMAIGVSLALQWPRKRFSKSKRAILLFNSMYEVRIYADAKEVTRNNNY